MLEPGSFDVYKNTTVPMIVMLDCSEINMEVLDTGMETVESSGCREVLGDDGDANNVLATI